MMDDLPEEKVNFEPDDDSSRLVGDEAELGDIGAAKAKIQKLREQLKEAQKKRDEYLDGWQRCKADSINAKKDAEARAERIAGALREDLVHDIIPALDSFDMAAGSEAWATISDGWKSGMEQVRDQLLSALKRHGIERFGRVGDALNHALHEVVEERDDIVGDPNTIVRILRYGYKAGEKILRPAQVIVKKAS